MKIFDQDSYNVTTVGPGGEEARTFSPYFFDGSDALANQNYLIHITHVPTNKMIRFKAFICLLYTSPSPRDATLSRMPSSA